MKIPCKYCGTLFNKNINNQEFCIPRHYRRWRVKNVPKYKKLSLEYSKKYRLKNIEWFKEYQTQYRIKNNL